MTEVDPDDPLNPGRQGVIRRPGKGVETANQNHYNKVMTDVRSTQVGAESTIGMLARLEGELAKLPKNGMVSQGPWAEKRNEIARMD